MQWTLRQIRDRRGEANLCRAQFVDGLSDGELQRRFHDARDADYAPLLRQARALARRKRLKEEERAAAIADLRKRFTAVKAIDFFGAPAGQRLEALLDQIDGKQPPGGRGQPPLDLHG